jgi:SHS2 domain-containing protein
MIFETYDPLPVSADIDYQEMPLTCEEATTDAHQALVDFIAELENELRFEAFLMKKLENCCNDVEAEIAG